MRDYFKPKSVTWWSGVIAIGIGLAQTFGLTHPAWGEFGQVIAMLSGSDASPASLMVLGAGLIGIRAKLGRAPGGA